METEIATEQAAVIRRLFPVLFSDAYFFAVHKPARIDLEAAIRPSRLSYIDMLMRVASSETLDGIETPIPLILPERYASGVALFARSEEAARRLAGMATTGKLRFAHTAVVKGKPPRAKIAIKPSTRRSDSSPPASSRTQDPTPNAKLEILASHTDRHIARCLTSVGGFDDIRRCFKAGGLSIVGDERPSARQSAQPPRPTRHPLLHLEELRFPHPFARKPVLLRAPTPRGFQAYLTKNAPPEENLHIALARRVSCLLDEKTDSFRLFAGRNEGISGLAVELLNDVIVIETLQGRFHQADMQVNRIANFYERMLEANTVIARQIPKRRDDRPATSSHTPRIEVLKGNPVEETVITENGLKFIVKPSQGIAAGLFLDQRDNRRRIMKLAKDKHVLNLFAYTCGFSVVAAAGGAASTTSVDLAAKYLEWGRRNFAANDIDLQSHIFIKDDAFEYIKRAKRQKKTFDVIILDPPSFSRSKKPKRTFEIKKNLVDLIAAAADLLAPGGHLLLSTNYRQVPLNWLIAQVEEAAADRSHRVVARCKLPVDFAADPDHQKSILVRFT